MKEPFAGREKKSSSLPGKILCRLGVITLVLVVASASYVVSNFYGHLDVFSDAVKREDGGVARQELLRLHDYYALSHRWKTDWLANRFLFADAHLYEAKYLYLFVGDYDKVKNDLRGVEDSRAYSMTGSATFRLAQKAHAQGQKGEALKSLIAETRLQYEEAVKRGPSANFDDKWNYDLLAALESGEVGPAEALADKGKKKEVLGFDQEGEGKQKPKRKQPGQTLNDNEKAPKVPGEMKPRG